MTLAEAMKEIEEDYRIDDALLGKYPDVEVCSGGVREKVDDPLPALYATEEAALSAWEEAIWFYLGSVYGASAGAFAWREKPKMEKLQTTIMDACGTHRLVNDRFAVTCKIVAEAR